MKSSPKKPILERRWLCAREIGSLLFLHPVTVLRLAREGKIPSAAVGRTVRFDRLKIEKLMERKTRKAKDFKPESRRLEATK